MKIAIVGATGEVGRMIITCLQELNLKLQELDLYASAKSQGTVLYYLDQPTVVQELSQKSLSKHYDYVFFSAGGGISHAYAPEVIQSSELIIDNSSAFRQDPAIPLVVPQINAELLSGYQGIVANPNCSTIQMVLPLAVLDHEYHLKKVIVSTYQAVSGSGHGGIQTLENQRMGSKLKGIYPELIDLNVIPQIGVFMDSGYSAEEEKMHQETRKILAREDIAISATAVRVPVNYGHSLSVYAEFEREVDLDQAAKLLKGAEAIKFHENSYITPLGLGTSNLSHVCRLRLGVDQHSLSFWNVGHNVRIGAAANAVNIMHAHALQAGKIS
ncbi:MAG: aspartate-semialdehyde dehydrogenase [Candidatus Cloacimonetes bacterium]|jgi:aspartate-semialdehyde dehydrogenase|nr:aspartate-semialdehyde dehydrogenase [Candidatus Cloacimonadota bacterium]MDY0171995.1 aspartate-semialdehyde dehydrogenase [Candidatus Cloacimonadaceae bacterium]